MKKQRDKTQIEQELNELKKAKEFCDSKPEIYEQFSKDFDEKIKRLENELNEKN